MPMTKAEWLACTDLGILVSSLRDRLDRRWLLALSGLCRVSWASLDRHTRDAVRRLECHAEARHPSGLGLEQAIAIAGTDPSGFFGVSGADQEALVSRSRAMCEELGITTAEYSSPERRRVASLLRQANRHVVNTLDHRLCLGQEVAAAILRDIIGNPFRRSPPLPPAVLNWNDRTVPRIAQGIYDDRKMPEGTLDAARLAVLADALLDAGCDNEALIAHCREPGPHVRGCWAVDLILGKE
jgi:hypothetical protein